jgi:uroporphyrinogen-III decarboxylase
MVDMDEAFDKLGEEIVRCGNLDPVAVIQDREASEIRLKAEQLCKQEDGRPFILSGGCEITVNTPADHLKAMRKSSL